MRLLPAWLALSSGFRLARSKGQDLGFGHRCCLFTIPPHKPACRAIQPPLRYSFSLQRVSASQHSKHPDVITCKPSGKAIKTSGLYRMDWQTTMCVGTGLYNAFEWLHLDQIPFVGLYLKYLFKEAHVHDKLVCCKQ